MGRLLNTRTSRYYVTDDNGKRRIVHPGQHFEGSAEDAKQAGIVKADSREGKAYAEAIGAGAEPGELAFTPDQAEAEARENDPDRELDRVGEAAHGTDLVARSMATARIRDPHGDPEALLEQAVDLAEADVGDGPVGTGDIDPETGENRDNIGEPGAEPPERAADGRPIIDTSDRDDNVAGTPLSPDEAVAEAEERRADGEPPIAHAAADGGTITAAGHPEAIAGTAPASPAPADGENKADDGAAAAKVEFTSDAAKDKAKSLKVAQSSLEAGKGSGADGKYTVRDVENIAAERKQG